MLAAITQYLVPPVVGGLVALVATLLLTPAVGRVARHYGWVDHPSEDRWSDRTVALLGGVSILAALAIALAVTGEAVYSWPVWIGAGLISALGLTDDLKRVRADAKVLVQVLGTVLLLYGGYRFWAGGPIWVSVPLTFLWVIGVTNALNLLDGIDGLAAGVSTVAAGTLVLVSVALNQPGLALVPAVLAGAALGFAVYNFPPARIFMGDCGSLLLGFMLATVALDVQTSGGPIVGTLVPVAVLAVPIADTTFVTITRLLRGHRVTDGGTDHVHHRLIRLGVTEQGALAVLLTVSAIFGAIALVSVSMDPLLTIAVAAFCLVATVVVGTFLAGTGTVQSEDRPSERPAFSQRVGAILRTYLGGPAWKSVLGILADLLVVGAALIVALHLRYGGAPPTNWSAHLAWVLPATVSAKLIIFYSFGLYQGIWRHAGTPEAVRLVNASMLASLVVGVGLWLSGEVFPVAVSVILLDWGVTTIGIGAVRFGFRGLRQYVATHRDADRRTLVYGSGEEGMLLLRHLRSHPALNRTVVGLIDDDPSRHGYYVQGVRVLGGTSDLPEICADREVEEVIVPAQGTSASFRQAIQDRCARADVECQYFEAGLRPADPPLDGVTDRASAAGGTEDPSVSSI